ncbi:hypothetical protein [Microbispora sp. H10836]|uniref:hypothetical protein n=1 Tax=Microbispora sp. H10836 TaxID=2729106 RepID=UPI001B8CCD25|nr:hypothetical protein [Microbispora sp. H10836]
MEFVDTSILCNLLDVPGKNQHQRKTVEELRLKRYIAQLGNGHDRRDRAKKLHALLDLVIRGEAPWVLPHGGVGRTLSA